MVDSEDFGGYKYVGKTFPEIERVNDKLMELRSILFSLPFLDDKVWNILDEIVADYYRWIDELIMEKHPNVRMVCVEDGSPEDCDAFVFFLGETEFAQPKVLIREDKL